MGCPWRIVRPKYESAFTELRHRYPLNFVIVGREGKQDSESLLATIKNRLLSSSFAILDVTGGNANVSLEYGLADAYGISRAIYLSTHGAAAVPAEAPILADLAGQTRQQYAQQVGLQRHLGRLCEDHEYTRRFETFLRRYRSHTSGRRRRLRTLALKVVHALDGVRIRRRSEIVDSILGDPLNYVEVEVSEMILHLHQGRLLLSQQGPHARVSIRS